MIGKPDDDAITQDMRDWALNFTARLFVDDMKDFAQLFSLCLFERPARQLARDLVQKRHCPARIRRNHGVADAAQSRE